MARFTLMRDDLIAEVQDLRSRIEEIASFIENIPEEDPEPQVVSVLPAEDTEKAEG